MLRSWLSDHHTQKDGIWLISYKKHTAHHVPYGDIVEECLCFGWVDSLPRSLDDARSMLYLAPRRKGSKWSKANKARVEALVADGLMKHAGLQKIEQAKKDGAWDALNEVEAGVLPDDLKEALSGNDQARKHFEAFPPSSRCLILEWISNARKSETRIKRIHETVDKAARNIRANHYRQ
ncbi:MAG: YdeI/OmpD-associated family protein [Pseudomonadota bacterium]